MLMAERALVARYDGSGATFAMRRRPREEWRALLPGAHEGYVDWESAEAIRLMVSNNVPDEPTSRRTQAR